MASESEKGGNLADAEAGKTFHQLGAAPHRVIISCLPREDARLVCRVFRFVRDEETTELRFLCYDGLHRQVHQNDTFSQECHIY